MRIRSGIAGGVAVVALTFLASGVASAAPPKADELPDALRPWQDWVLHGSESARCPFFTGDASTSRCVWPARVELSLAESGGSFSQSWLVSVSSPTWVPLPGDAKHWPQSVTVDGASAVVVPKDGLPGVLLRGGSHAVHGSFSWDSLPESVAVPSETGLLALTVNGKTIDFPERDDAGRVWLSRKSGESAAADRLEVFVHRKVTDDVPLQLTTEVELHVSGKSREAVLGKALPDGFVPMALDAPMPARIEPDGHLRVQIWPGNWTITVVARHVGKADAISPPKTDAAWAPEEVWSFEARPSLRLVEIQGVPAIDPQQTTIPADWKRLPTYRVRPGETMTLVEKRRGDANPPPDQLSLSRTLWLDFDGHGYSVQDHVRGTLHRAWRLGMGPETTLGRVSIDGKDQFITQSKGSGPGVEVRQGTLNLTADSRIEHARGTIPAVGWAQDFAAVGATLQLPPGWRLFAATGADDVPDTWIRSWSLLDMFLVLILAISIGRLYGVAWGALSLATLVLIFPEPGAPRYVWIAVLVGEAIARVVPANWFKKVMNAYRLIAVAILLVIAVPFFVKQIRGGLFPALAGASGYRSSGLTDMLMIGGAKAPEAMPVQAEAVAPDGTVMGGELDEEQNIPKAEEKAASDDFRRGALAGKRNDVAKTPASSWESSSRYADVAQQNYYAHDPKSMVQTGAGVPQWTWTPVRLQWSGPVAAAQKLSLWLVPPWLNLVLAFVRVLLCLALVWLVLDVPRRFWPKQLASIAPSRTAATAAMMVLAVLAGSLALPARAHAADLPSKELLDELRARLLEKPECFPDCASSPRMELSADGGRLTVRMEVGAAAGTAIPLPGSAEQWMPEHVALDGAPASGIVRVGDLLWLSVPPGTHQVLLDGPLPKRATVQLRLPLKPHQVTAKLSGWTIAGLHEDGLADDNLQLSRLENGESKGAAGATLSQGSLPPFVRVERTLVLGLNWQVVTRVVRLTPPGSAAVLEVPLIPGESVTTNEVRVVDGKALVNMGAQASSVEWLSALAISPSITLTAPDSPSWTELWKLDASSLWHAEAHGIPVVHVTDAAATRTPEWRPWPGESVTIDVTRPEGVTGQTLTVDHSSLELKPGKRATDATLSLSVRSSRGGQHVISIPENAELQSVTIDGTSQPIRQDKGKVTLPLVPGAQQIVLTWREPRGVGTRFAAPTIDLGSPSVNAETSISVPTDRWVLFAGGPRLGPAVLFWSVLIIILLTAIGLGREDLTPLKTWQWILLGLGLSQIPVIAAVFVAGWLLALGWRKKKGADASPLTFNLAQVTLAFWTALALGLVFWAIGQGLLGTPEMQVSGNGSYEYYLHWFADRTTSALPRPWLVSLPLWTYHVAMLAWALWIAFALLGWLRWGWTCFTEGGLYKPFPVRPKPVKPVKPATPPGEPAK